MRTTVAFDTETHQIAPGVVAPRIVCATWAERIDPTCVTRSLGAQGDPDLRERVEEMLLAAITRQRRIVTHNGGFDYGCVCVTWPDLIPLVFEALQSGSCEDTLWNEKLLNLSDTGCLDAVELPDGSSMAIEYGLADLERRYLGRDRSAEKDAALSDEHWRTHFGMLDGWPAAEFPSEAAAYAMRDAEGTLLVDECQQERARGGRCSARTGSYRLLTSFCLFLETAWGMAVDRSEVARVRADVERVLNANKDLLLATGVLRGGSGSVPMKRCMALATEAVTRWTGAAPGPDFDWAPYAPGLVDLGVKFKAPVAESVCQAELQRVAAEAYRRIGAVPTMTDGRTDKHGVQHPQIKLGDEETELLAAHCPIMAQYHLRKSLGKLVSNQLPILESADVIHFKYNALVETTRTSSSGNAKGKPAPYPAANGQQVPKAIEGGDLAVDVRRCYRPRPGTVFFDVDLHCLELACVGQKTHDLFGQSVHLERYNAGYDLHAYLAAGILARADVDGLDAEAKAEMGWTSPEEAYRSFAAFKKHGVFAPVYKKYRSLAKPIGLGFPGGIGPAKMVTFARVQYGVQLTEDKARELREMWRDVYPEMRLYFDWISSQRDHNNDGPLDEEGRRTQLYWYVTPMGAVRRGCTFCSAANGASMQSPGAEAATAGNNAVVRACHDPALGSVLYGARPIAFVHDQVVGETGRDPAVWHEQAMEVSRLMIEAARVALPKVHMRTEALLTAVWSKSAEPTFDAAGRLVPWRPETLEKRSP